MGNQKVTDDGGKKMMTDKEAKKAISEYMVKVIYNNNHFISTFYSKTDLTHYKMFLTTCMGE